MPWWNLPETLRAAVEAMQVTTGPQQAAMAAIAAHSCNAFFQHFVRRDLGLMASQTLDADGHVIDVIPATPDADPGYHTGLSLIDAVRGMQRL